MLCVLLCQVTLCVTVGSSTHTWRETGQLECQVLCERLHLLGVKEHESHLLKGSSGAGKEPGRLFKLLALKDGRSTRVQGTGARTYVCVLDMYGGGCQAIITGDNFRDADQMGGGTLLCCCDCYFVNNNLKGVTNSAKTIEQRRVESYRPHNATTGSRPTPLVRHDDWKRWCVCVRVCTRVCV